jgi:hypothetical protein
MAHLLTAAISACLLLNQEKSAATAVVEIAVVAAVFRKEAITTSAEADIKLIFKFDFFRASIFEALFIYA